MENIQEELEVLETEEAEEEEVDELRYDITSYPSDMTLRVYYDKWKDGQLIIPDFQRKFVWDIVQSSKLIESFLIGIPVPGVFLYKEQRTNKLLVIDGQQRIESIARFFEEKFDERLFRLKNVRDSWNKKTYSELSKPDQYQLQDSILRATVVQQLSPDDHSSVYHIFERLNTGGVKLSAMEIRKCVYAGPFYEMLSKLNRNVDWRRLIGKEAEDKRLRDIELILRVLALYERWEQYEKPMKSFLNQFMNDHRAEGQNDEAIKKLQYAFNKMCKNAYTYLPSRPFHLRGRLNMGLMDAVLSVCAELESKRLESLQSNYKKLLEKDEFLESITYNTSDSAVVKKRFNLAKDILCS